ncbi:NEL-type E3 ubiquitin ligase domain-containing protein [Pseudomonas sp. TWI929]|uniref:NEL-type E3 ubiquitin ligase domain-containing protein n=1 Tax=Pseudomonas sp. TWI929 TaxID=3136795 RepID=UPI0032082942
MTRPTSDQPPRVDVLAMEQAYQDSLIVTRLPKWLRQLRIVSPTQQHIPVNGLYEAQHEALRNALRHSLACRQWLKGELARIEGIDSFARPLLQQAVRETAGAGYDSNHLYLRSWYTRTAYKQGISWGRHPLKEKDYFDVPLIEAALSNFTEGESRNEQPKDNCIIDNQWRCVGSLSAPAFARLCRQLDLGGRYQRHLDSILEAPASQAGGWQDMTSTLARLYRSVMLIDACKAKSEGVLSGAELQLVLELCNEGRPGTFYESKVVARQLQAFGSPLQQIVVLEVLHEGWLFNASRRIIVYIPGDPNGPWSVAADLETFIRKVLGKRLRSADYQTFFTRFVRRRDSRQFFSCVASQLVDVVDTATREMDQHLLDYPLPLFDHLASARIAHIKDDAAVIAVPVADMDRQEQAAHDKRMAAVAWTLSSVAGVFIPALNAVLLAVMVWDLLGELFHAVEDWREGDSDAAMDHLLNVTRELAFIGATAVIWREASRAWAAVDSWVPARLDDSTQKLWNGDLQPYRSVAPPVGSVADAQGVYRAQGRSWITLDGHCYEAMQGAEGEWQLKPHRGHAPALRHNGAGAWRLWSEQPASWTDRHWMFRRLGERFARLDNQQIDQAMAMHGLDTDNLRALHVYGRPPDAEVFDTLDRLLIDSRIQALLDSLTAGRWPDDQALLLKARALPGVTEQAGPELIAQISLKRRQFFQQLYNEQQAPEDAPLTTLRRAFPSLHRAAAAELVKGLAVEGKDYRALIQGTVPFRMVDKARLTALRIRVARACEALFIDTPQTLDLAKAALTLLQSLDARAVRPRWRLYDGDAPRPVFVTEGGGLTFRLVHKSGLFELEDALGVDLAGPGELFATLRAALDSADFTAMGINEPGPQSLRRSLAGQVSGRTDLVAQVLGKNNQQPWLLTPTRLADGRVGYPLGGILGRLARPLARPRAFAARLRDLYPAYSEEQINAWLVSLHAAGRDTERELGMLEQQARQLERQLRNWEWQGTLASEKAERKRFRKALMLCWRELIPYRDMAQTGRLATAWHYTGYELRSLPELGAAFNFPHVTELSLGSLLLTAVPDGFLRCFPNLVTLGLSSNFLQRLPAGLSELGSLRILDLSDNRIALDRTQADVLGFCSQLRYLNLSNNNLYTGFSVSRMPHLMELRLRDTGLAAIPTGLLNCSELYLLDAANNRLTSLPTGFVQSRLWQTGYVQLSGNPLPVHQTAEMQADWNIPRTSLVPLRLRWLDRLEGIQREGLAGVWICVEQMDGSSNFLGLLSQLTQSRDFKHPRYGEILAIRVFELMESMQDVPQLAEEIFSSALIEHCADNATVVFGQLEIRKLVWQAERAAPDADQEGALVKLARQLWRQGQVDLIALHEANAAGVRKESIEWALAYSIRLRDVLALPGNVHGMLHEGIPNLSDDAVANVRDRIRESETAETLSVWMVEQPFWRRYMEQRYARELEVPEHLQNQLQPDADEQAAAALMVQIRQWTEQTELQLTAAALQRWV